MNNVPLSLLFVIAFKNIVDLLMVNAARKAYKKRYKKRYKN